LYVVEIKYFTRLFLLEQPAFSENGLRMVPSVATPGDYNILQINPKHPDFEKIKIVCIEPFEVGKCLTGER